MRSLRITLLLLVGSIMGCSEDAATIFKRHEQSQQAAADQIKAAGGEASQKTYPLGEAWVVKLSGVKLTDEIFESIKVLQRVAELDLSKSSITDVEMPRVVEASGGMLFKLNLSDTAVTDGCVPALTDLVLLSEVDLAGTKVSKGAIAKMNEARKKDPKIMPQFKTTRAKF